MSAFENFEITTTLTAYFAEQIAGRPIKHREIPCPGEVKTLPDGSNAVTNDLGEIVYMNYAEGSTIMRFRNYVMCTNGQNDHWFRSQKLNWYRLD